jgi:energy-coupling factor transporter ATP-binding protein EcfA2
MALNAFPSPLPPIRIEIGGSGSVPYKSIDQIIWEDIPPFVVLTGLNGSGKTQLIDLLAYKLAGIRHPELGDLESVRVQVTGDTFGPDSVAYIPSRWSISGAPSVALAELQQVKQNLWNEIRQHPSNLDFVRRSRRARLERHFHVQNIEQVSYETFMRELPDDFSFMLDDADVIAGLAHVFVAHRLRIAEAREAGTAESKIRENVGPAPWEVLNETFAAAGFQFQVPSPIGTRILDHYELTLTDLQQGFKLRPMDLSSGEKTLLGLVLWLYNSQHHGRFPKLFLMDEPDAHLHPSMTRHFLDVVQEVLVDRYGVRVILTTHSPSTVALAPENAIFEMRRAKPRIVRPASKAAAVGLLTAGLVIVSPGMRYVLVEDNDDAEFFTMVLDVLSDYGPSRDPRAIKPTPSITFVPASLGAGRAKIPGGKSVVMQWLAKFDAPPLAEIFRGVIDRDSGNLPSERLFVLQRYSIENYYLDPLVIFAVLSDQGKAPAVADVAISQGQEHLLRSLARDKLQRIVDAVAANVEPQLGGLSPDDTVTRSVTFTNGISLDYPVWMLDRRGHDLLSHYQRLYGGPGVISPPRLARGFRRVRMIPAELADIMDGLQT